MNTTPRKFAVSYATTRYGYPVANVTVPADSLTSADDRSLLIAEAREFARNRFGGSVYIIDNCGNVLA